MKTIFISPVDVLFFRDGRSFSAGEDHEAQTLFPPLPTPIYGALRSAILSQKNAQFRKGGFLITDAVAEQEVGSPSSLGTLQINFFALAKHNGSTAEPLFPMPADVLKKKKAVSTKYEIAKPTKFEKEASERIKTNFSLPSLQFVWSVHSESDFYESASGFLSINGFQKYLEGKIPNNDEIIEQQKIYEKEPRTGIRLKKTKTTGDGQLFSVEFIRMASEIGFLLTLDNESSLSENGFLRLGGEGKAAIYKAVKTLSINLSEIQKKVLKDKKFKVVLATPAVFKQGWIPDGINSTGEGELFGCKVKLIGASLGRYISVGGWDLATNRPKPTQRAVPAGSVYFFEMLNEDSVNLFTHFGKSMLSGDWAKQGFGLSFIGAIS